MDAVSQLQIIGAGADACRLSGDACGLAEGADGELLQISMQGSLTFCPCLVHSHGQFVPSITRRDPHRPPPFMGTDIPPDRLPLRLRCEHFPVRVCHVVSLVNISDGVIDELWRDVSSMFQNLDEACTS
jgi:hypothetical protein